LDFARRLSNKVWSVHDGQVEVYPGSLGDYLEKLRAEDLAREGAEADARASGPVADDKEARLRQREADKRAQNDKKKQKAKLEKQLAELEAKIAALEAEQAKLEAELADPATHADVAKGRATSKRYDEVRRGLEAAMGSWAEAGDALASLG
jgi:ATPase subunit of ABC transporter with duplicated ATPase domains